MTTNAVYNLFGWNGEENNDKLEEEEYEYQKQWERDFESGEKGIVGELRQRIREAKHKNNELEDRTIAVKVRDLDYISPPLHSSVETPTTLLLRNLNMFKRVKRCIHPDESKRRHVLSNINFDIKEHSMTLVIGSPGSGKVSFHKSFNCFYLN